MHSGRKMSKHMVCERTDVYPLVKMLMSKEKSEKLMWGSKQRRIVGRAQILASAFDWRAQQCNEHLYGRVDDRVFCVSCFYDPSSPTCCL